MNRNTSTIVRTAVLALALINQILTAAGLSPLPIENDALETLISTAATVAAAVWAWWKNNSVTAEARQADIYLDNLKEGAAND